MLHDGDVIDSPCGWIHPIGVVAGGSMIGCGVIGGISTGKGTSIGGGSVIGEGPGVGLGVGDGPGSGLGVMCMDLWVMRISRLVRNSRTLRTDVGDDRQKKGLAPLSCLSLHEINDRRAICP
jgi:hypothetical protein